MRFYILGVVYLSLIADAGIRRNMKIWEDNQNLLE